MASAGPWVVYNEFKENLGKKLIDLSADAFKIALFTSTSNVGAATLATATYGNATNEVANGSGYLTGGVTAAATWVRSTGTVTFDTADASWTASGGSITARWAVLYDNTPVTKYLIAFMLLDSAPADTVTADGNTLTISIANVFTLT